MRDGPCTGGGRACHVFQETNAVERFGRNFRASLISKSFQRVLFTVACILLLTPPANAKAVPAQKAYDFVDSLGVVVHVNRNKGVLSDQGWAIVSAAIAEAGFRYVRATIHDDLGVARVRDMHARYGTRFNLRIDSRALEEIPEKQKKKKFRKASVALDPDAIDRMVAITKRVGVNAILSYEGPNEYNSQGKEQGNRNWHNQLKAFMHAMYRRIKEDPAIADKPVIAPSIWRRRVQDYQAMGDISDRTDRGCLHNYTGGRRPSYNLDSRIQDARILTPEQRIWVTEFGFRTAGKNAVSETAKATYLPRFAAEFFIRPLVERVFNYQIIDEWPIASKPDKAWGLLRNDFSKRPSFYAMKNTIALLDDKDGDFTPGSLDYDLVGDLKDVHSFLVQKKNGTFYLVLWQEVESWDREARKDLHPAPRSVKLMFNAGVAEVRTYLPTGLGLADPGDGMQPVAIHANPIAVPIDVPDELLVVEIFPAPDNETIPELDDSTTQDQ